MDAVQFRFLSPETLCHYSQRFLGMCNAWCFAKSKGGMFDAMLCWIDVDNLLVLMHGALEKQKRLERESLKFEAQFDR